MGLRHAALCLLQQLSELPVAAGALEKLVALTARVSEASDLATVAAVSLAFGESHSMEGVPHPPYSIQTLIKVLCHIHHTCFFQTPIKFLCHNTPSA